MKAIHDDLIDLVDYVWCDKLILVPEVQRSIGGAPWVFEKPVWIRRGERYRLVEERRALPTWSKALRA